MRRFEKEAKAAFENIREVVMGQTLLEPSQLVIAGGAARLFSKADDIDLWVLADKKGRMAEFEDVESLAYKLDRYAEVRIQAYNADGNGYLRERMLVAKVHDADRFFRPVQILVTSHPELLQLVESFDISTHMVGVDLVTKEFVAGPRATTLSQKAEVLRWNTPQATLARLIKIQSRYGLPPNVVAAKRLRRLIDEGEENGSTETNPEAGTFL